MEIKAIMTTWSTKSKTPSRSQFVTDKKHCVAGRLMLFWYLKSKDSSGKNKALKIFQMNTIQN